MSLKSKKTMWLASTVAVLANLGLHSGPASAQQAPASSSTETRVEKVTVTGSRIKRKPENAPTPLIQLDRESILMSGEANVIDYLADLPALQASIVPEDTTGAGLGDGGLSLLNLRNLGAARTLVLVDGKRHVGGAPGTTAVDVDTIPRLLIQNVEVITGGSSAVYGADAVSGVVNFVLRKNVEGLEFDGSYATINQDGQTNYRLSGLGGTSLLDGRLRVYLAGEYEESQEVMDKDIDWQRKSRAIVAVDADPAASPDDGVFDARPFTDLRSLSRPRGGVLTLAHATQPSPTNDPDIPFATCPAAPSSSSNCFALGNPGRSFVFDAAGNHSVANLGSLISGVGLSRTLNQGGDGDPLWTFQDSRLPEADAWRFQGGAAFDVLPGVTLSGEIKYVREHTLDNFQPAFFDVFIRPQAAGSTTTVTGISSYNIGLDNAYLPPALLATINTNTYNTFAAATATAPGAVNGTRVNDARAQFRYFLSDFGARPQDNTRETKRYVLGLEGDLPDLGFVTGINWEISGTWGKVEDENIETKTIDVERLAFSTDAVVDTLGVVSGVPGQVVCRVRLNAALGQPLPAKFLTGVPYAATDPAIANCRPSRLFGTGGIAPQADYIVTQQTTTNYGAQKDVSGSVSFDVGDYWGAGQIGMVFGGEYRREEFSGQFIPAPGTDRFLFANALASTPKQGYKVKEYFLETNIPLIVDQPGAKLMEVGAAFRSSEYTTIGHNNTLSLRFLLKPNDDLMFRATYGESVRAPDLSSLFSPLSQTFLQISDPCSVPVQAATADPAVRASRIATCGLAVWRNTNVTSPAGPDLLVPPTFIDPNPTSSNAGRTGGNPFLKEEESYSYTLSVVLTPSFIDKRLSVVVDYYNIEIQNAIASLTAQSIMNNCADNGTNVSACQLFARDPVTFEIIDFIQAPLNFALLRTQGIDFAARYGVEVSELIGEELGGLDFSLRGNYLIRRQNFVNPTLPWQATEIDGTVENPRVRVLAGVTWTMEPFALTWETDWQSSQEILDDRAFILNPDSRPKELANTGAFVQHDLSMRYLVTEQLMLRAGVVNLTDEEPSIQAAPADIFDLFGRRYFLGLNVQY